MFVFPKSAENVKNVHERYFKQVMDKFPCPEGFQEIPCGYAGKVFDRITLEEFWITPVDNLNWDIGEVNVQKEDLSMNVISKSVIWFVMK